MFNKWKQAIPLGTNIQNDDVICDVHFSSFDIETHYTHKLTDGTISRIERGIPLLKSTAVPCIFPSIPVNLQSSPKSSKNEKLPSKKRLFDTSDSEVERTTNTELVQLVEMDIEVTSFFENVKQNLNKIDLPTLKWTKAYLPEFNNLMFVQWNCFFQVEKQVIFHFNSSIQVSTIPYT